MAETVAEIREEYERLISIGAFANVHIGTLLAEIERLDARLEFVVSVCELALRWRQCVNPPTDHIEFMEALDTYLAGKEKDDA
jgi:hypothetical protein